MRSLLRKTLILNLRKAIAGGTIALTSFIAVGCNGSNTDVAPPFTGGGATPTPVPAPLGLSAVQTQVNSIGGAGATFTVTEAGYAGNFTIGNGTPTCSGIATATPTTGAGPSFLVTVTGVAHGSCQLTVKDSFGQTLLEQIYVTVTSGTIN